MNIRFSVLLLALLSCLPVAAQIDGMCPGFGSNGIASSLESHATHLNALTVLSNGKIVAVGYYDDNTDTDFLVARYNANGTPDVTFAENGVRLYKVSDGKDDKALCVAVAADGNLLIGGTSEGYGAMIKIDSDGDLVSAFGESGKIRYSTLYTTVETILIGAGGNIYAAGKTINSANIVFLKMQVNAFTSDGSVLSSFSDDGKYDDPEFIVWHETVIRAALQNDGKIVVAGTTPGANASFDTWSMIRLNSDGSPDTNFGTGGRVDDPEFAKSEVRDIVVTENGSIYLGGFSSQAEGISFAVGKKFKANGESDNSFNMTGSGIHPLAGGYSVINALAVDEAGKMFVAGSGGEEADAQDFLLGAFTSAGNPDDDFGAHTDMVAGATDGELTDIARLTDGSFVVCGYALTGGLRQGVLRKHKADGTVLSTFNNSGNSLIRFIEDGDTYSIVMQPDGKMIIGGVYLHSGSNTGIVFARFHPNGEPDLSFGTFGYARYDISNRREFIQHMALLPDGKILAAGSTNDANYGEDYLIVKLNVDGSLDQSFGTGGIFKKHVGAYGKANEISQIAVDAQGRILIAGDANYLGGSYGDATIMRVLPNGTVDTNFADNGIFRKQLTVVNDYFKDVAVASDGSIYVAGNGTINLGAVVMKLNDAGAVDTGFGTDGIVFIEWDEENITFATDILIQPDGKLLISCGYRDPSEVFDGTAFLHRLNADGTPDQSFGDEGIVNLSIFGASESPQGLLLDATGAIYVSGQFSPATGQSIFLVKVNADGSETEEPYVSKDFYTRSNIAMSPVNGNIYMGVSPDGLGGMHVICLGKGGDGQQGDCTGVDEPTITHNGDVLVASDGDAYEWYRDGDVIDGETEQTLTIDPVTGGTFTVQVTVGNCSQFSDDYDYFVTAVLPGERNEVQAFPNPFSKNISVLSAHDLSRTVIKLYSITGAVLHQISGVRGNDALLEVQHLNAGAYILSVESPEGKSNFKLIKHN